MTLSSVTPDRLRRRSNSVSYTHLDVYKRQVQCWPWGIVSSGLWAYASFYQLKLYSDAWLQIIYIVLGAWGWHHWKYKLSKQEKPISRLSLHQWVIYLTVGSAQMCIRDRGTDHHFTMLENGSMARYVLSSKVDQAMNVYLDLRKNHVLIQENIPILVWGKEYEQQKKTSPYKNEGLKKLNDYKIEEAIEDFLKALDKTNDDPEIYFHLACAYSILENPEKGFESLQKAIQYGLKNKESVLTHEMLAFLRIHERFEDFMEKNY